jgi:hypothetical protein
MRTSEIFEMQMAYGETGYFELMLEEVINDLIPQLDTNQLSRLGKASWDQRVKLSDERNENQQDLPF